jgi:hypothetical protein
MFARAAWCVLLVATLSFGGRVAAQTAPAPDLRTLSLSSLKAGRTIRVGGRDIGTVTGRFAGVRDGSLWLGADATGRSLPLAGIDSVWVGRSHASTGAIVGTLVGIVVGAAAISGKSCSFLDNACMTEGYATLSGIMLGGTVLGAIIGGQAKSWELRYP